MTAHVLPAGPSALSRRLAIRLRFSVAPEHRCGQFQSTSGRRPPRGCPFSVSDAMRCLLCRPTNQTTVGRLVPRDDPNGNSTNVTKRQRFPLDITLPFCTLRLFTRVVKNNFPRSSTSRRAARTEPESRPTTVQGIPHVPSSGRRSGTTESSACAQCWPTHTSRTAARFSSRTTRRASASAVSISAGS
jgi:hypothetical protein